MNIAVAAFAICSLGIPSSQRFPVNAVVVHLLFVSMAGDASWFGKTTLVRKGLDGGVAIYAGEHGAVNRRFECVSMHVLAVDQRRVTVTAKTVVVGKLWRTPCVCKSCASEHKGEYP